MADADLEAFYGAYIACLNRRDWARLADHVHPEVHHNGRRRVSFTENVFYELRDGRIAEVWSVIDKASIKAQLKGTG